MLAGLLAAHLATVAAMPQSALAAFEQFPATPAQSVTAEAIHARAARAASITALDGRAPLPEPSATRESGLHKTLLATTVIETPRSTDAAASAVVETAPPAPPSVRAEAAAPIASPAPKQPTVVAARVAEPTPVETPLAAPNRYATRADLIEALGRTRWDPAQWATVISIAFCEAGADTNRDGIPDVVDTRASGAGGLYLGVMQIGQAHRFSAPYDLRSLVGNLSAGYELWLDSGRSFAPWGCR